MVYLLLFEKKKEKVGETPGGLFSQGKNALLAVPC
jgi:hypothetical protein